MVQTERSLSNLPTLSEGLRQDFDAKTEAALTVLRTTRDPNSLIEAVREYREAGNAFRASVGLPVHNPVLGGITR